MRSPLELVGEDEISRVVANTDANRSLAALRLILHGREPVPYGPRPAAGA